MYEARIKKHDREFSSMIVRVEKGQNDCVINTYGCRFFKTLKAAERSTDKYIKKINAEG